MANDVAGKQTYMPFFFRNVIVMMMTELFVVAIDQLDLLLQDVDEHDINATKNAKKLFKSCMNEGLFHVLLLILQIIIEHNYKHC